MGGQIIDATVVPAPKQRNTQEEKAAIREGRIPERWKDKPAKLRQKDTDARWSVKYTKAKGKDGADPKAFKPVDLAIPMFGYKNHIGIDRAQGPRLLPRNRILKISHERHFVARGAMRPSDPVLKGKASFP